MYKLGSSPPKRIDNIKISSSENKKLYSKYERDAALTFLWDEGIKHGETRVIPLINKLYCDRNETKVQNEVLELIKQKKIFLRNEHINLALADMLGRLDITTKDMQIKVLDLISSKGFTMNPKIMPRICLSLEKMGIKEEDAQEKLIEMIKLKYFGSDKNVMTSLAKLIGTIKMNTVLQMKFLALIGGEDELNQNPDKNNMFGNDPETISALINGLKKMEVDAVDEVWVRQYFNEWIKAHTPTDSSRHFSQANNLNKNTV